MEEASTSTSTPVAAKPTVVKKTMSKQFTGKREDSPLHSAVRRGDFSAVKKILSDHIESEEELRELLQKQNQCGETALYVAAEYGDAEVVAELIKYYDLDDAETKARNGFDPFHIAAKQGELGMQFWFSRFENIIHYSYTFQCIHNECIQKCNHKKKIIY